jgi:hypothetical protein
MAVYREGYLAVEVIKNSSTRIWNDACDFGAPCKEGDKIWNAAKQLVEWYQIDGTRKQWGIGANKGVSVDVELMDEWAVSDGRKSVKNATERYRVTFNKAKTGRCNGFDGFVSVDKIK